MLASSPTMVTPTGGVLPFSMTLVGTNGLLITDPGANGVLTLNYSSTTGTISNSKFTSVSTTLAGALCWSTYSPNIGHYYVIGAGTATIVELSLNLGSTSSPVTIVQSYQLSNTTGTLESTVVSLAGKDYLYVLGTTSYFIIGYQLYSGGNATTNWLLIAQQGTGTNIPKLAGIATFVQTQSSAASILTSIIPIMVCMVFIFIHRE
jgi:hypothetical protein